MFGDQGVYGRPNIGNTDCIQLALDAKRGNAIRPIG